MAKAIYGHVGADARLLAEVARLRAHVRQLEAEVAGLQALLAHEDDLRVADLDTVALVSVDAR